MIKISNIPIWPTDKTDKTYFFIVLSVLSVPHIVDCFNANKSRINSGVNKDTKIA